MSIFFHSENVSFSINEKMVVKWLKKSVNSLGFTIGELSFIFCSDEYIKKINIKYLTHHFFTDVITFDYSKEKLLFGDVYISIERVKENSKTYKTSFNEEMFRVIIHGVLHLCGFDDKTKEEKSLMRSKENDFLSSINWKTRL
ncbi:rRNA maturation RNase YbeY [Flavobacteriales bacterium]|nr:rRNA maturation RNase YbeY [Flavobacteriales bacterium]